MKRDTERERTEESTVNTAAAQRTQKPPSSKREASERARDRELTALLGVLAVYIVDA